MGPTLEVPPLATEAEYNDLFTKVMEVYFTSGNVMFMQEPQVIHEHACQLLLGLTAAQYKALASHVPEAQDHSPEDNALWRLYMRPDKSDLPPEARASAYCRARINAVIAKYNSFIKK